MCSMSDTRLGTYILDLGRRYNNRNGLVVNKLLEAVSKALNITYFKNF